MINFYSILFAFKVDRHTPTLINLHDMHASIHMWLMRIKVNSRGFNQQKSNLKIILVKDIIESCYSDCSPTLWHIDQFAYDSL